MHIEVTSSGSGCAQVFEGQPIMIVNESLFIFDITTDVVEYIKTNIYPNYHITNTNIFQVENYKDIESFKEGLRAFIKYGIFENQDLCDKSYILTTREDHTTAANEVWPEESRSITKFTDKRKWPRDNFVKEFIPIEGSVAISGNSTLNPDRENLKSWFFEFTYGTEMTEDIYDFDPEHPDDIPIPLEPGIEMPPIPDPPETGGGSEGGGATTVIYKIHYFWWHERTGMPFQEVRTKVLSSVVASNTHASNTVTAHVWKQDHVTITVETTGGSDGGGS